MSSSDPIQRPFRLLVFDWDGTLMDSIGAIVACTLEALREMGREGPSEAEVRDAIGLGLSETFEQLFPAAGDEERQRIRERIRGHWLTTYRDRPVLIAGVRKALKQLQEKELFLAVATGKGRAGLDHDLEATDLNGCFLATRTADRTLSKPHPQMLLELMDELGVAPEETLMIGDTTFDLEMAQNAGSAALGVLTGSHDRDALARCTPLEILESVRLLPQWLEER